MRSARAAALVLALGSLGALPGAVPSPTMPRRAAGGAPAAAVGRGRGPGELDQQRSGPPRTPKNLQVFPKDTPMPELTAKMRVIAASLGVKCVFCHVRGDCASDAKPTKHVARRMLRMVAAINDNNFSGRPEVSCYTCHRGSRRPVSQPPIRARGRGRR